MAGDQALDFTWLMINAWILKIGNFVNVLKALCLNTSCFSWLVMDFTWLMIKTLILKIGNFVN